MKHLFIALLLLTGAAHAQTKQTMKAFVLLVKVPSTYTTALAKSVNPKWEQAIADWKASGHYITSFAYPGESRTINQQATKENERQVSSILLRAENIEEATELAKACPVLAYGGSVEIRELPKGVPQIFEPVAPAQ